VVQSQVSGALSAIREVLAELAERIAQQGLAAEVGRWTVRRLIRRHCWNCC
jgi:hypothetical protein